MLTFMTAVLVGVFATLDSLLELAELMRGFGFKDNGYFVCTETSPRCYVIQEVSDVNQALNDINKGSGRAETSNTNKNNNVSEMSSPHLPFLPWWFTENCRQQLLSVPAPSPIRASTPSACGSTNGYYETSTTPEPPGGLNSEQLRMRLKNQLEYYFSRENLMNDRYLRSQMDSDQYVPIKIVASFPKVTRLTTDYNLIVNVLKDSTQVQVDEIGEKVRPVSKRCTIILREIPEDADEKEVKAMFDGCPGYQTLSYAANNSWYVTFNTEEETQQAFMHVQNFGKTFNNKPVYARIKTGSAPIVADVYQFGAEDKIITNAGTAYKTTVGIIPGGGQTVITGQITIHDNAAPADPSAFTSSSLMSSSGSNSNSGVWLGQVLAECGYVPRATFKPSVTSTAAMTSNQQSNIGAANTSSSLAFTTPTVPISMPMSVVAQQPRFLLNRSNMAFAKSSSIDVGNEADKNQQTSSPKEQTNAKKPQNTANVQSVSKSNALSSQAGRPNRSAYSSTNAASNQNYNNANSSNNSTASRQTSVGQGSANYNVVTPLNKLSTHAPDRSANSTSYKKSDSYQQRAPSRISNNGERRERTTNSQSGRPEQRTSNPARSSNIRNENRTEHSSNNNYHPSSKPTHQRPENRPSSGRQFNSSGPGYNGREFQQGNSQKYQHESSDSERPEHREKSYDYIETDFPCLVEKQVKRQDSKQPLNQKEEKAKFSAVVAGHKTPKPAEEKRQTYAQSLKRSVNTNGPTEHKADTDKH
ncbi:HTH La-type RNA-binding domain-containing protein [Aphelenchoides bicaudatus]|nr:HTH La-type RNA-binding domain-containing protein [Aphelenchoides bicaudatus]